jgi:hypothetical protein
MAMAVVALLGEPARARAALDSLELSPDIVVSLGAETLGPEEVGNDALDGTVSFTGVGIAIPVGVDIDAFERLPGGVDALFSTDVPAILGGVFVGPADVVSVTAGAVGIAWSASAAGLPPGANVDAIARLPDGDLLISLDTAVLFGGFSADDEDAVRVDLPGGGVSLAFDGSRFGLPESSDLDALDALIDGSLLLSFDTSGVAGGVDFSDEDALSFDPGTQTFALAYDGSARYGAWLGADLDAVDGSLDPDGDSIADAADLCPFYPETVSADADGDHRGDECECTDQTGDGLNTVLDLVAINVAIFDPALVTPLCDGNNDGACDVNDISSANAEIFSPTSTSTCARQPVAGP